MGLGRAVRRPRRVHAQRGASPAVDQGQQQGDARAREGSKRARPRPQKFCPANTSIGESCGRACAACALDSPPPRDHRAVLTLSETYAPESLHATPAVPVELCRRCRQKCIVSDEGHGCWLTALPPRRRRPSQGVGQHASAPGYVCLWPMRLSVHLIESTVLVLSLTMFPARSWPHGVPQPGAARLVLQGQPLLVPPRRGQRRCRALGALAAGRVPGHGAGGLQRCCRRRRHRAGVCHAGAKATAASGSADDPGFRVICVRSSGARRTSRPDRYAGGIAASGAGGPPARPSVPRACRVASPADGCHRAAQGQPRDAQPCAVGRGADRRQLTARVLGAA